MNLGLTVQKDKKAIFALLVAVVFSAMEGNC
jgi:hypothetical protein